jgi:hypothetical protein
MKSSAVCRVMKKKSMYLPKVNDLPSFVNF